MASLSDRRRVGDKNSVMSKITLGRVDVPMKIHGIPIEVYKNELFPLTIEIIHWFILVKLVQLNLLTAPPLPQVSFAQL